MVGVDTEVRHVPDHKQLPRVETLYIVFGGLDDGSDETKAADNRPAMKINWIKGAGGGRER